MGTVLIVIVFLALADGADLLIGAYLLIGRGRRT
jgi:hypothetical protein